MSNRLKQWGPFLMFLLADLTFSLTSVSRCYSCVAETCHIAAAFTAPFWWSGMGFLVTSLLAVYILPRIIEHNEIKFSNLINIPVLQVDEVSNNNCALVHYQLKWLCTQLGKYAIPIRKQESIPVGCIPPAFVFSRGYILAPSDTLPSQIPCPPRKDMGPMIPYPPVNRLTDVCENITFPKILLLAVNMKHK